MITRKPPKDALSDEVQQRVATPQASVNQSRRSHAAGSEPYHAPELAVVIPTLNERDNIETLLGRLESVLTGLHWEVIFVDDNSQDGTVELLNKLQSELPNVRLLRRIGRRGLSSACIEGMLATPAPFLAVMDADLQHDEAMLPHMLEVIKAQDLDVVIGTRFAKGGSVGDFSRPRLLISRLGSWLSRCVSRVNLSDPMSGFFMLRRSFFDEIVPRLSGQGFKILLDVFASASHPVRFVELPYHFRVRRRGASKLDTLVMLEYMTLVGDKLFGRYVPVRFVLFVLVGLFGVLIHLGFLGLFFRVLGLDFYYAQMAATLMAMTVNFNLNNVLTYRDRRLRGLDLLHGHLSFYVVCSIGAIANFQIAEMLFQMNVPWALAGLLGAIVGSVWNYGVSSTFTWKSR